MDRKTTNAIKESQGNAAPMRALAIVACLVCAIAAVGLAFMTLMDVAMIGFPDSHVTDYGKAVEAPLTILGWAEAGFGLLFLALAFSPIGLRARAIGLLAALIVFVLVAVGRAGRRPLVFRNPSRSG